MVKCPFFLDRWPG